VFAALFPIRAGKRISGTLSAIPTFRHVSIFLALPSPANSSSSIAARRTSQR